MNDKYYAAIDISTGELCFAVGMLDGRKILAEARFPMKGRDSSGLILFLEEQLARLDMGIGDVKRWTIGTGPGTFSGMRILSSLIQGVTFGRDDVQCRGIPSAFAIASSLKIEDGEELAVLYPQSSKDIYCFFVAKKDDEYVSLDGKSGIYTCEKISEVLCGISRIAAFTKDIASMSECLKDRITWIEHMPVHELVFMDAVEWDRQTLSKLIYMRPAVTVEPMMLRTDV